MSGRYFYGWNVVAATFVMALFSFGLGFYGLSVYVATLQRIHGWSASAVSAPVTVYYVAGALLTMVIGAAFERFGPRVVVCVGSVAMAAGVAALGSVTQPWQLYPTFLVMSLGWGAMSGAAVNIIPAPWFERRRGLAVSVAFNGATLGGVTLTPALYPGGAGGDRGGRSWDEERSSEKARSVNRAFILSRLARNGGSEWRRLK
jgi:MFS family permease